MSIQQTITYHSSNQYFAGFLNELIIESRIEGSVSVKENEIILLLNDNNPKKLDVFVQLCNSYLPYSIFLGEIKTLTVDFEDYLIPFESPYYDISLCPRCTESLLKPSSDRYLDDSIQCNHYSNKISKTASDTTFYSPHYSNNCTLLLCDATIIDELFILTENEKKVLFSIEKPTLKVTIKNDELKSIVKKQYINIKLPFNIKSSLASINAKDSEINYLFFQDTNETKVVVVEKNITIIKDTKISSKLENFSAINDLNRFLNIAKSQNLQENAIGAYLSLAHGISFMVTNEVHFKKVIIFQEFSLEKLLINMNNDKEKSRLLKNFKKSFQDIIEILNTNGNYNLFEVVSIILELDEIGFEPLSDKSLEFRGNGGLKIDMNYLEDGFDYVSFIGSIMSFKLANTPSNYLAYSIFEAFGDMTISTLNQLKEKFKIQNFVMMGNMFDNTVLYSRILSKFQLSKPHFSKSYAIDD